jgi:hypothetical protein
MKEDKRARITKGGRRRVTDSKAQLGKGEIQVKAHMRHMNMPERSFLRSTLDEFRPSIRAVLNKAIGDALEKS